MTTKQVQQKWNRRYSEVNDPPRAAQVLQQNQHLLSAQGEALDLACGLGGNAMLLAQSGLNVQAWDISSVAIERLQSRAEAEGLPITAILRDVDASPPKPESFDVIVVSYFLQRSIAAALCSALRPGGLLFYQTFVKDRVSQEGPSNPDFFLLENELLTLFAPLKLRVYREEGILGDTALGLRNEALFIGQR